MLKLWWLCLGLLAGLGTVSADGDAELAAAGLYQIEGRLMKIERDPDPEWFRVAFITVTGGADTRYGFPT